MPSAARYLRIWLAVTLLLLAGVGAFNLIVDPYGLFRIVSAEGFNRIKSQAHQRAEMFKRIGSERLRPNTLILGNSRAEIGFDPESPVWPKAVRPVFNLALPGTGVSKALSELDNMLVTTTPQLVLVGLDFLDFRAKMTTSDKSVAPRPLRLRWLREALSALFTFSGLIDSLATIKAQYEPYPTSLTETGFNPMRDYVGIARREGYYAMFRQRDQENAISFAGGAKTVYLADGQPTTEFRAVEKMIAIAKSKHIKLRLLIYPYHVHTLVLFHHAGLWPAFEDWKRELVALVDRAGGDVELWDFSGFGPYADEAVPQRDDTRTELRWYWEAGHFKKALGDAVLTRLFEAPGQAEEWGYRLSARNLDDHLQRQRMARDYYENSHPQETAELAALVPAAKPATFRSANRLQGKGDIAP